MYSPAAAEMAKQLGLKMGRPNLEEFADTLVAMAQANRNILAVTSDSRGSGKLGPFGQKLPDQIVELGIAEQNLVGISAGLASCGKIVFAVSPACFLTARSLEQIKNDVCYSDNPVKLIGISAGVSYGALGSTHHSLHDLAVLRAINNIEIVVPADNFEAREVIKLAAARSRPMYIRFGKAALYGLPRSTPSPGTPGEGGGEGTAASNATGANALTPSLPPPVSTRDPRSTGSAGNAVEIGRGRTIRDGTDVAFLATGETVIHALLAAESLKSKGLNCRVLSLHTIKPLDTESILSAAKQCRAIVTVEEHMINGGLGEAVASLLMQAGVRVPMKIVGIPDEYTVTGSQADIFRHYGISMEGLAQIAVSFK
jgi:transketolase